MNSSSNRGNVLIITMITIAVISALAGVSFTMTSANSRLAARDLAMHQAQALAEGSLEVAFAQWKRYTDNNLNYSNGNPPSANALKFISDTPPSAHPALAASFAGFTLNTATYKVVPLSRTTATDKTGPIVERTGDDLVFDVGTTPGTAAFTTTTHIYRYRATAEVTANPPGGPVTISLSRFFEVSWSPLVQKAIFYEDTMDIFPGAKMDIIGDVQANGTAYAGGGDGGTDNLHFWQNVSIVGNFNNFYNPNDPRTTTGTPAAAPNWDGGGQTAQLNTQVARQEVLGATPASIVGNDPTNVNVQGGIHEIVQIPTNSITDPQALADRRFYNQADYRILVNPNALPGAKVTVNFRPGAKVSTAKQTAITAAAVAAVNAGGSTIKDFRQGTNVTLTNVDVGSLSTAIAAADDKFIKLGTDPTPFNGVLYVADTSVAALPTSDSTNAIRLQNGAVLSQDLTIASQNPVYLQGDYNTGLNPNSDNMSKAIPTVAQALSTDPSPTNHGYYEGFTQGTNTDGTPYDRKSAMVATDAINLLSNNWKDANSYSGSKSDRVATPTTMNTAMLTGNVPTTAANKYSGGVENLPRFLESWSGIGITVYGSFIELFPSRQFRGTWANASYDAPKRRWFFERRFLQKPAPGTFLATTKQRAAWVRGTGSL